MRLDRVIFEGENPFEQFSKCKELTVLLDKDKVVLVATINSINLMVTYGSRVIIEEGEEEAYREAYTVPLSLMTPLFKLAGKKKNNELVITTEQDMATINFNGVEVVTSIYSPNGLTLQQVMNISAEEQVEFSPKPFIDIYDVFGVTMDNYCNVDGKTLFIADANKCLIQEGEVDYGKKFSVSVDFIRLMKSMGCTDMHIGQNVTAKTKGGMFLITNLHKVNNPNVLQDYKFARRLKSEEIYSLSLGKYLKQITLAAQSTELSLELDLNAQTLKLYSTSEESMAVQLTSKEVKKDGEVDLGAFAFLGGEVGSGGSDSVVLTDARLVRTLARFNQVKVKVCPTVMLARLGDSYRLMFTLGESQ